LPFQSGAAGLSYLDVDLEGVTVMPKNEGEVEALWREMEKEAAREAAAELREYQEAEERRIQVRDLGHVL
jgi:hypothetical protein